MPFKLLQPEQGKLLVSEPSLQDFYFNKSVVLLAEHNAEGSFGIIINKPVGIKLQDVLTDFPEINFPLFFGGPVNTNCLYFIHRVGNKIPKSVHITDGIFWGGDIEIAKQLINDARITNNQIRFFIGYSGWNPNQLTQELKEKSWVVTNFSDSQWDETPKMLWGNILRTLGGEYTLWANSPSDPAMN